MKKRGFTLIELLAVIVILAIVALVAVPVVLNVVNDSKKSALKDSVYNLTKAAENYVFIQESKGNKINWNTNKITNEEYVSFNLSNKEDVKKLNVKGSVPDKGRVEITKRGDTFVVAIDDNVCAKKNYGETLVNLLSLNSDNICMLTASSEDLSSEDANDIIATITNLSSRVESLEKSKTELETKNATLESKVNTIQGETIDKIYPVGSIYISTDLNTVDKVEEKFGGEWEIYGDGRVLRGTTETSGETGGLENVQLSQANLPEHNHSYTPAGSIKSTFTGTSATSSSTGSGYTLTYNTTGTNNASSGNQSANHTHSIPALSGTAASAGNHYHTMGLATITIAAIPTGSHWGMQAASADTRNTSTTGAHTHSVTTNASTTGSNSVSHTHKYTNRYVTGVSGVAAHTHTVTAKGSVSSSFTGTASSTGNTGSNTAFSVLDPYITVYMYKRVK